MRDLREDLKIIESIPGQLNHDERVGCVAVYPGEKWNCLSGIDKTAVYYGDGYKVNNEKGNFDRWEVAPEKLALAKFIFTARIGWPHAIHRALAAEAKIQSLEQAITEALRRQYGIDDPKPEQFLGVIRELRDRALAAEARVRELEEAISKYLYDRDATNGVLRAVERKGLKP